MTLNYSGLETPNRPFQFRSAVEYRLLDCPSVWEPFGEKQRLTLLTASLCGADLPWNRWVSNRDPLEECWGCSNLEQFVYSLRSLLYHNHPDLQALKVEKIWLLLGNQNLKCCGSSSVAWINLRGVTPESGRNGCSHVPLCGLAEGMVMSSALLRMMNPVR